MKKESVLCVATKSVDLLTALENRILDCSRMVRVVALVIKFKEILLSKTNQYSIIRKVKCATLPNTSLLEETKTRLIKMVQQRIFEDELRWLKSMENSNDSNKSLDKRSKISRLDPFLDGDEVIHVRGRLDKSFLNDECKHPILFPKVGKITDLLIKHYHKLTGHSGRGITLNEIHSSGYWIIDANSALKNIIYNCADCRRYRERLVNKQWQFYKLNESAAFTHCGKDMFGPFVVKQRRSGVKRYGAMFACMANHLY